MSAHEEGSQDGGEAAASGAGSHAHEVFDAEPVQQLSEGEPRSPLWLPALGIALFVVFGLYLAVGDDDEAPGGPAGRASASAALSADPAGSPPKPLGRRPGSDRPKPSVPVDIQRIRKGLRDARGADPTKPPARPAKPHVHKPGDVH
ncbi:MAG: hypothetical protein JRI68_01465 [Deltaproteobacteria bacterium]|nr:hypothetical protein [Deltaproteobacteria bacterium]